MKRLGEISPSKRLLKLITVFAFLVSAGAGASADGDTRQEIRLNQAERLFVLAEMRAYVVSLQKMMDALARDDMATIASAARPMGMQAMSGVPPTLMSKVPDGFRQLGMPTHMAFDQIANNAESGATTKSILGQLG